MSKRAEEAAMKAVPIYPPEIYADMDEYIEVESERNLHRTLLRKGYEQAEKDLGWHSVEESLPPVDEEVIVLTDEHGTAPIYKIASGHIVKQTTYKLKIDSEIKEFTLQNHNGWNIPGVKFWMPMPKIPNEK